METKDEIYVPDGFPVRGLYAFAQMMPDNVGAIRDSIVLMASGIEHDVAKFVESINEREINRISADNLADGISESLEDTINDDYMRLPVDGDGFVIHVGDEVYVDNRWHKVVGIGENEVFFHDGTTFRNVDPTEFEISHNI